MLLSSCRKQQQQQVERGDYSPCGTPTGVDARDPYDLQLGKQAIFLAFPLLQNVIIDIPVMITFYLRISPFGYLLKGARMFYTTQDMLWRRKLEEQALELQSRRLMGLQLLDIKKHHHRALSTGSPIPSPTQSPNPFNQNTMLPSFHSTQEVPEGIRLPNSRTFFLFEELE